MSFFWITNNDIKSSHVKIGEFDIKIMYKRLPYVSGYFYPDGRTELNSFISECLQRAEKPPIRGKIIGAIVPHAGYVYSAYTACHAYRIMPFRGRKVLLIGPNHASFPPYAAIHPPGKWITPLGEASVDAIGVELFSSKSADIVVDPEAHAREHSLEVQLPFIQHISGNDFSFVPIVLGNQNKEVIMDLVDSLSQLSRDYIIIASSDMNHYESEKVTLRKDQNIIEAVLSLNVDRLYEAIRSNRATPCGYGAIAFLMEITKRSGGEILLLDHTTSAAASGDYNRVVGYASFVAYR